MHMTKLTSLFLTATLSLASGAALAADTNTQSNNGQANSAADAGQVAPDARENVAPNNVDNNNVNSGGTMLHPDGSSMNHEGMTKDEVHKNGGLQPHPQERFGRLVRHHRHPVPGVQPEHTRRLGQRRSDLGPQLVVTDPHRAVQLGAGVHQLLHLPGELLRVRGGHQQEGLVPTRHFQDAAHFPQRLHHGR